VELCVIVIERLCSATQRFWGAPERSLCYH